MIPWVVLGGTFQWDQCCYGIPCPDDQMIFHLVNLNILQMILLSHWPLHPATRSLKAKLNRVFHHFPDQNRPHGGFKTHFGWFFGAIISGNFHMEVLPTIFEHTVVSCCPLSSSPGRWPLLRNTVEPAKRFVCHTVFGPERCCFGFRKGLRTTTIQWLWGS